MPISGCNMKNFTKIILWPFENAGEIIYILLVFAFITLIEISIVKIPDEFWGRLVFGNIVIAGLSFWLGHKYKTSQINNDIYQGIDITHQQLTNIITQDKKQTEHKPSPSPTESVRQASKTLKNPRATILHFEDDSLLASMYLNKFQQNGFYYVNYSSPADGPVEITLKERPDIIIMDIIMPKMDGLVATKLLKADERTVKIPILGLCNIGQKEVIKKVHNLGMVDYLISAEHIPQDTVERVKKILSIQD